MEVFHLRRQRLLITRVKNATVRSNIAFLTAGCTICVIICTAYIVPSWRRLVHSMHNLISIHVTLGLLIFFGVVSTLLGLMGVYIHRIGSSFLLGLQIFAMLFLAVIKIGVFYSFLVQWITNLPTGVTFAVQLFRPGQPDQVVMSPIQQILYCCGRKSYTDYYVANDAVPVHYVPYSCCNRSNYTKIECQNVAVPVQKGKPGRWDASSLSNPDSLVVPKEFVYPGGCLDHLQWIMLPTLVLMFGLLLLLNILSCIVGGVHLQIRAKFEPDFNRPLTINWLKFIPGVKHE